MFSGNQLGQIFPLLRVVAVTPQLIDAKIGMRAVGQTDRCRCARNFLDRNAVLEIAQSRAAILLLDGDPVQAERAEFWPQIARELIALVDFSGTRGDLIGGEIMDGLANRIRGFTEIA